MDLLRHWTINTCPKCGTLLDRQRGLGGWWCSDHGEAMPPLAVDAVPATNLRGAVARAEKAEAKVERLQADIRAMRSERRRTHSDTGGQ